jgi:hypothetical protein
MNPEDAAAARFKEIRRAKEQIGKAERAFAAARSRLEELQQQVGPAERRDHERLGDALIAGKKEPDSEADAIRAEVARQEQRVEALRLATDRAYREIPRLVNENRTGWRQQAMRDHEREAGRYEAAIAELRAARETLIDTATLIRWLDTNDVGEVANPAIHFDRTLEELQHDAGALAAHPGTPRAGPQPEPQIDVGRLRDARAAASVWGGR